MRHWRCWFGHDWKPWTVHTNGPCVFNATTHVFRYCKRRHCKASEHLHAEIKN